MTLLPLAAGVAMLLQSGSAGRPRAIVAFATRAVEHDSAAVVATAWKGRVWRHPGDQAALLGLATIARLTYDYARAQSLYASLLAPGGTCPTRLATYARLGQALAYSATGAFPTAAEWFARAALEADAAGDSIGEAEALVGGAVARARTAGPAPAEQLLRKAARIIPASDAALWAAYHLARAQVLLLSSDPAASAEATTAAMLAARVGEPRIHAAGLQLMASDLVRRGESDSALSLYAEAIRERERARDRGGLATSLQWRGFLLRTMGAYGDARRDLSRAVAEGELSRNRSAMAWALTNLATISLALEDVTAAARDADSAAALFAEQGDHYGLPVARELQGGVAAALDNIPEARTAYQDALGRYEAGRFGSGVYTVHIAQAMLAMRERRWAAALHELDAARASAQRYGLGGVEGELAYHVGALALRRGDFPGAARALATALAKIAPTQASLRYATHLRRAELFARTGDLASAGHELTAAVDRFDTWRAALGDRELRLLAYRLGPNGPDPEVGAAWLIARLASAGRLDIAFHAAERLHARALLEQMARADAGQERRRASRWGSATLAEVARALPDDSTALLEFVTGSGTEPATIFIISRHSRSAVVLPPDDELASTVARFDVLIESGVDSRELGRTLGAKLLDPVAGRLPSGVGRLIVVPDGVLHRLTFDALILADGRYAVDHFAVSVVPSAAIALRLWERPSRSDEMRLLALADPWVAGPPVMGPDPAVPGFSPTFGRETLTRLPAAAEEALGVARYAPFATVLLGKAATATWLRRHPLTPYRIIHFATHAVVDDAVLGRTALALAPGDGEDGLLRPEDLARLHLAADLVVLSGCRTARGVVLPGEGVQGLTAPLLEAGAQAIVVTWWPIADRGALPIVDGLYRWLAAGRPVTTALQAAKLAARQRGASAREWAAFTLAGDPLVRVPLRAPSPARERVSVLSVFEQP